MVRHWPRSRSNSNSLTSFASRRSFFTYRNQRPICVIADVARAPSDVRFAAEADILSDRRQVCYVPQRTHAPQQTTAHSITSSARASSVGGMMTPSAFAVFKLITSSNLVGRSTGRSPGFAPLKILSTKAADRRN